MATYEPDALGPLSALLQDDDIIDIMVDAPNRIYAARGDRIIEIDQHFSGIDALNQAINALLPKGIAFDAAHPIVDIRLATGARLVALAPPIAADGPALAISKPPRKQLTVDELIGFGAWTHEMVALVRACAAGRLNILVAGGAASGKTTVLNLIAGMIPPDERVITVEERRAIRLERQRWLALEARMPDAEGRGGMTFAELVRQATQLRPDRLVVGELNGAEVWPLLQAINTGHEGTMALLHATSPRDALARLEMLAVMAEPSLPLISIREQIAAAFNLIIQTNRLADGRRRITHITEVAGLERDVIILRDLMIFEYGAAQSGGGRFTATGERPAFLGLLAQRGTPIAEGIFAG